MTEKWKTFKTPPTPGTILLAERDKRGARWSYVVGEVRSHWVVFDDGPSETISTLAEHPDLYMWSTIDGPQR